MSLKLFDLTGKTALITGGSQGLGYAIATGLGEAGAKLVVNGRNKDKMEAAVSELKGKGISAFGSLFDVTSEKEVQQAIDKIEAEIGPIDILVNNAGIIKRIPLENMEVQEWEQVININLTAPFIVAKHVVKYMIARKSGKIINICSMMSEVGRKTVGAYAASKGGIKMLTKNMATEWARHNIQTNGIGPGYFETEITAPIRYAGHPFNDFIVSRTPASRWGLPDELKGTAIFLASQASDFVNGHIVYVDGGILATLGRAQGEE